MRRARKVAAKTFSPFLARPLARFLSLPFSISASKGGSQKCRSGRVSRVHPWKRRWLRKGDREGGSGRKTRRVRQARRGVHPYPTSASREGNTTAGRGAKSKVKERASGLLPLRRWTQGSRKRKTVGRRAAFALRTGSRSFARSLGHVDFFIVTWLLLAARSTSITLRAPDAIGS